MEAKTFEDPPTVLIVEDDTELTSLYRIWLEEFCTVHVANDCESAYSHFDEDVDVVLLDRDLPDGKGGDILTRIREMELGWSVAIVSGIEPSLRDLEMPFDEYIEKPVEKEEIITAVTRLYLRSVIGDRLDEFYSLLTKKRLLEQYYPNRETLAEEEYPDIEKRLEGLYSMLRYANSVGLDPCSSSSEMTGGQDAMVFVDSECLTDEDEEQD